MLLFFASDEVLEARRSGMAVAAFAAGRAAHARRHVPHPPGGNMSRHPPGGNMSKKREKELRRTWSMGPTFADAVTEAEDTL